MNRLLTLAAVALACAAIPPAFGQDVYRELEALRMRVDSLERQNHSLQQSLQRLPVTDNGPPLDYAGAVNGEGLGLTALERRLDELEAKIQPEAPKAPEWHEVGSDLAMTAKWNNGL